MLLKKLGLIKIFVMMMILCLCSTALADELEDKYTFFLGPVAAYNSLSGDFNGTNVSIAQQGSKLTQTITPVFPYLKNAFAYGFTGGVRNDNVSLEFCYLSSTHDAYSHINGVFKNHTLAEYRIISLDGRYYLMPNSAIQPFFQFGLSFPWLSLDQNAYTAFFQNMSFYGLGLNIGGGVAFNVSSIMITVGAYLRTFIFNDIITQNMNTPTNNDNFVYFPKGSINLIPSVSIVYVFK
ncbi:MAG: hypothetical protein HQK91_05265 [Nitrospirae bacterium]|nr:hypothetical protein [Nitrospirota bacterium]